MTVELIVPTLGESITEATVSKWLKKIGEPFDIDEPLVEIETDKITVEVPAPQAGSLSEIKVKEGDSVSNNQILVQLDRNIIGSNREEALIELDGLILTRARLELEASENASSAPAAISGVRDSIGPVNPRMMPTLIFFA